MDKNIPIQVQKRMAWTGWPGYIVCGNDGYTITFDFDDEWDEAAAKTARFKFRTEEGMKHTDQPFVGNTVKVPVLSNIREVEVGVFVGDLTTTTGATIRCVPSIRCDSGEATEYEKQRFDELMQLFNELLHEHGNLKTLAKLACVLAEAESDDGLTIAPDYEGVERLKFWGQYLRYCTDGSVIGSVTEETNDDGQKVLRLWLTSGPVNLGKCPDHIDIPVTEVKKVTTELGPDVTLNGDLLVLPGGDVSADGFVPMQKLDAVAGDTNTLQPNVFYNFGEVAALNIDFADGEADRLNEYSFTFTSGAEATVLTLPSSVKWVNELTVESNKRYEISVVDNVALWCAVDYEVTG